MTQSPYTWVPLLPPLNMLMQYFNLKCKTSHISGILVSYQITLSRHSFQVEKQLSRKGKVLSHLPSHHQHHHRQYNRKCLSPHPCVKNISPPGKNKLFVLQGQTKWALSRFLISSIVVYYIESRMPMKKRQIPAVRILSY